MASVRITDLTNLLSGSTQFIADVIPIVDVTADTTFKIKLNELKGSLGLNPFSTDNSNGGFISSSLTVSGSSTLSGSLTVSGSSTLSGSLSQGLESVSSGIYSHAQGHNTTSSGIYSHAEGSGSIAVGFASHAEGEFTLALESGSHAEGAGTQAIGDYSHAEGQNTIASGLYSHAEGDTTRAKGGWSHAEGSNTIASGSYSNSKGLYTIARGDYQLTVGKYNIESDLEAAFIIGNGSSFDRKNLLIAYDDFVEITGSLSISGSVESPYKSPYKTINSTYTATVYDSTIEVTSGTFTLNLYTAVGNAGRTLYIKNDGTGIITVDANGSETIDGQLTRRLAARETLLLQSDGSSGWIILNKKPVILQFGHGSSGISLDGSEEYYIGQLYDADPSTTAGALTRTVISLSSGWITRMTRMCSVASTLSGTEDSTLQIRNITTSTTVTVSTTLEFNVAAQLEDFTLPTPLQVTRGDQLQIILLTGNWVTRPNSVRQYFNVLIE